MRRKCKVFAALLLTLALTVCLALPSWAETRIAENDRGTITLTWDTADTNVTATAYKVINVEYDYSGDSNSYEGPYDPEFYWVNDNADTATSVAEWVKASSYSSYIGEDNSVSSAFNKDDAAESVKQFASEMAAAIRTSPDNGGITLASAATVTGSSGNTSLQLTSLTMGTYLILVEGGTRIYSPVFVSLVPTWNKVGNQWQLTPPQNVVVTEKSEALNLTKKVFDVETLNGSTVDIDNGLEDAQIKIGDTVTYVLEADVPNYPADAINTSYEISDKLPAGMSLNESSITVYGIDEAGIPENLTDNNSASNYYTLVANNAARPTGGTLSAVSFNLDFTYASLHTTSDPQTRFSKIRVVYTATANGNIRLVSTDGSKVNVNTAYLDYNNDPYGTANSWASVNDDANVYSYGIKVTKKDRDTLELLSGAIFTLKKDGSNDLISFVSLGNGSYRVATQSEIDDAAASSGTVTTNLEVGKTTNTGILQLSGLDVGTYILTEIQAPAGYHKPSAPISVPIQDNTTGINVGADQVPNGKPEYTDEENKNHEAGDGYVPVTVTNTTGFTLPSTGGMGTVLFTTFGILLMGAGLVVLVLFLRRRSTK